MNFKVFIKGLLFLCALAGGAYLLSQGMDESWIDTYVRDQGLKGWIVFISLGGLLAAVGFPRQILSFMGGYAFGVVKGTTIAVLATVAGCILTFTFARFLGRSFVQRKFPRKIKRIDDFLSDNPFSMTLLIRLLPAGSNVATNAAAGVSGVNPLPFVVGSMVGYIPQSLVFALAGSGIELNPQWSIALSVILFIVSGILGVYLYRRYRHGKTLGRDIETALSGDEQKAEAIVSESDGKSL
ncbi:VTT domain-containing protein [Terasakiella sp. SH-1]|uniref:TVP38/TMEM64 family protein n=1 Tax=Terasakiella sp. SH-1 TaxID=2560057 RepID=UPI0010749E80|nr:VTT domain-containing protein [Terasakiella sp. SH-1]